MTSSAPTRGAIPLRELMGDRDDHRVARGEEYLLDNRQAQAGQRFTALAELFNPSTFRHLEALGLGSGWRVWEVGAGGSSVPSWLAEQVGPEGRVLATDIDTAWMESASGYEVRRHDVGLDPPPVGPFDLVHARLLLVHVPQRDRALAAMVSTLCAGGWLVVEEADPALQPLVCPDETGPAQQLANRLKDGFRQLMAQRAQTPGLENPSAQHSHEPGLASAGVPQAFADLGCAL